jgi:hypothetical protein
VPIEGKRSQQRHDVIDFAAAAIEEAEYAALDAVYARTRAIALG